MASKWVENIEDRLAAIGKRAKEWLAAAGDALGGAPEPEPVPVPVKVRRPRR